MGSILVIEDEPILARNICEMLTLAGHTAKSEESGIAGVQATGACIPDVILLDFKLPDIDGFEVMRRLAEVGCRAAIIMMTAHGNVEMAVRAIQSGAVDFLAKPLSLDELQIFVERALVQRRALERLEYFRGRERSCVPEDLIVGQSKEICDIRSLVDRITSSSALTSELPLSVLITGETGTGKDLIAQIIHDSGPRRQAQFVHINCTTLPKQLIESELFGHSKGAFTDARADRPGLFEVAEGGTIFLDEIGHMELATQVKLLSVLEQRRFRPVGSSHEKKANVHVIAATNRDLDQAVRDGSFREDLYHRLRTLTIHMPPLRERQHDIPLLASYFLELNAARFGLNISGFTPKALQQLQAYAWPGNVRELAHTIENAVLMSETNEINECGMYLGSPDPGYTARQPTTIEVDFSGPCPTLDEFQRQVIQAVLDATSNNSSQAARILGISRDAIRYRLEKGQ